MLRFTFISLIIYAILVAHIVTQRTAENLSHSADEINDFFNVVPIADAAEDKKRTKSINNTGESVSTRISLENSSSFATKPSEKYKIEQISSPKNMRSSLAASIANLRQTGTTMTREKPNLKLPSFQYDSKRLPMLFLHESKESEAHILAFSKIANVQLQYRGDLFSSEEILCKRGDCNNILSYQSPELGESSISFAPKTSISPKARNYTNVPEAASLPSDGRANSEQVETKDKPITNLSNDDGRYEIIGVFETPDSSWSLVEKDSLSLIVVRTGDTLLNWRVVEVRNGRVTLISNGKSRQLGIGDRF